MAGWSSDMFAVSRGKERPGSKVRPLLFAGRISATSYGPGQGERHGGVEETLGELPEAETAAPMRASRHEHDAQRQGCRSGHYSRSLTAASGDPSPRGSLLKRLSLNGIAVGESARRKH